jgi:hypothetical protein
MIGFIMDGYQGTGYDSRRKAVQAFAENVSIADGPPVRDMGVWFTTRMIVVKLTNGSLWVDSPVSVPPNMLERIRALGAVRYLVTATPRHIWRLEEWHALFPNAELWRPPQMLNKFKLMMVLGQQELPFTGSLGDAPPDAWADDFDQLVFKGNPLIKEVFFFHKRSRTVILDDLIQNHPIAKGKPFRNALWKLEGIAYPHGGVPLDIRVTFTNRKTRAAIPRKAAFVGLQQNDHRSWRLHRERREAVRRAGLPMAHALISSVVFIFGILALLCGRTRTRSTWQRLRQI